MTKNEQLARHGYEAVMRSELEALQELMAPTSPGTGGSPGLGIATVARTRSR